MNLSTFLEKNETNSEVRQLVPLLVQASLRIKGTFFSGSGLSGEINIYGEKTLRLDEYAHKVLAQTCRDSGLVQEMGSEEEGEVVKFSGAKGRLGINFDPLDGSSNVPTNLTVGTIVGFYSGKSVLSEGRNQTAAFYILYGPLMVLVYANANGVSRFVLNDEKKFVLSETNLAIPEGKIMALGGLNNDYLPNHAKFVDYLETEGYKNRYSGTMVTDVHQVLHYGGIFSYPGLQSKPQGKLRLVFEANPLGFIVEKAGGYCSNGTKRVLDVKPTAVSDRTPVYIGSKKIVKIAEQYMKGEK